MKRSTRRWLVGLGVVAGVVALAAVAGVVALVLHLMLPKRYPAAADVRLPLVVAGQPFEVPAYLPGQAPAGVVVFGSGDGGWSAWEEKVARHLVSRGYAVAGWDCRVLADSRDYGASDLVAGWADAAAAAARASNADAAATPLWYGGWSTGAQDAVAAAAAGSPVPAALTGLLLVAPDSRGRYGIEPTDLLGVTPQGVDSYSLAELGRGLRGVPVAQFAAGLDPMDSTAWLDTLTAPHRLFELDGLMHDMGHAGDAFLADLDEAMTWTRTAR